MQPERKWVVNQLVVVIRPENEKKIIIQMEDIYLMLSSLINGQHGRHITCYWNKKHCSPAKYGETRGAQLKNCVGVYFFCEWKFGRYLCVNFIRTWLPLTHHFRCHFHHPPFTEFRRTTSTLSIANIGSCCVLLTFIGLQRVWRVGDCRWVSSQLSIPF